MNSTSKEDEEKGPYQEFDPKTTVEKEKPTINFLVKGFFGESNPIQGPEIIEVNSSGGDDDEDDEAMSPISPLKGKSAMNEDERISKIQELKFQHKELSIKLNSVDDRINKINNKEEEEKDESSQVKLTQLQKQRELLTKYCEDIIAIKEKLEDPNLNWDNQKNKNLDQTPNKTAEHEKKLQSHKRKLLMTKIRVKILELFRRVSSRKIEELENDDGNDDDKLSCDTYLFTSLLLEYLIFFLLFLCFIIVVMSLLMVYHPLALIIHPILVLLKCSNKESLMKSFKLAKVHAIKFVSVFFQISVILIFFTFLFAPGVLVVVTQVYCISNLQTVTYSSTVEDSSGLILLKELMVVFFFFLSMKEVSSAIANIGYHYKRTIVENSSLMLLPMRACAQLLQIVMTFWFCYINIYLIEQVDDVANLIQNFAALAVVLEFDNYVMSFLRYMKFYKIYHKFLENFLGKHDKKKMSKAEKEKEIQGLLSSISQYEKLLHEIRETRSHNKKSKVLETVEMKQEIVKQIKDQEKKENLKKKIPPNPAKTIHEESSQQKEKISVFFHILDSIMNENENTMNGAINFLAQKNAIKIMLTKEEFPIEGPFVLDKLEKLIFDLVGFFTVGTGILVIILIFANI